ncbi:sigma 54-interacting transcriptional regulator [Proteinivorax tanatarense]|uniref:HTH-type transcriptional regulatory protein TyrR n=1 Tax=Proteinivorax tanatarense TaxID=1260629 RepID=A0AAU7VL41_9FIRM
MNANSQSILNKGLKGEKPYSGLYDEISSLLDSIQDGIYITDGSCNTLKVNAAWEKMSNTKEKDVLGRHMKELVEEGVCNQSVSLLVAKHKRPVSILHRIKSGKEVLITGTPIIGKGEEIATIVTTVRDMDELNKLKSELKESKKKNAQFQRQLELLDKKEEKKIIGKSSKLEELLLKARQVACYSSTVLITGESGVGKEVIAKLIHNNSNREGAFIPINCGAIPENLLESELFGFAKGAFTGADSNKIGLIEAANGGTLLLDEVADLPMHLQVKVLRFIQTKMIKPVGSSQEKQIDVRIVAATNKELDKMVEEGSFRQDLYYRLNVIPIKVPSLRERQEDIIPLAEFFLSRVKSKLGPLKLSETAKGALLDYKWPGNIRELENLMERISVLAKSKVVTKQDLQLSEGTNSSNSGELQQQLQNYEKEILEKTYNRYKTTREIAKELGISQTSVVRKLKKYKLT